MSLNRRAFLATAAAPSLAPAAAPCATTYAADVHPAAGPLSYYRVDPADPSRLAIVPRWDVPEVLARSQPEPLASSVGGGFGPGATATIERRWRAADVAGCRLCARCADRLSFAGPDAIECAVDAPADALPADEDEADAHAALWSERHGAPLPLAERGGRP